LGKLDGKTALITGGSEGIGLGIAKRYVDEGAKVIIFARNQDKIAAALAELGDAALGFAGDATNLNDLDSLYAFIENELGQLDIVVANAGMANGGPFLEMTEELFDAHMNLNVKGVYFTLQKAVPLMRRPASFIIIGSTSGSMGLNQTTVYGATKAAMRSLARNLTVELSADGIRCNVLSPGFTRTPLLEELMATPDGKKRFDDWIAQKVPMNRIADVAELAAGALFLGSEESSFVTGVELHVDGGMAQI
jgi:NAD(P)-dependent dehydrogenase (short-subunit alcohol dehydrogenase family)|tara:strand:+ start:135 stop:884 length:750 start_codon:yes stop_codon:yes gene_type:complete